MLNVALSGIWLITFNAVQKALAGRVEQGYVKSAVNCCMKVTDDSAGLGYKRSHSLH
jgi:hypothetical protein